MATPIAGRGGQVLINGTPQSTVALVKTWQGQATTQIYDSTSLGDTWTQGVVGFRKLTGTITGSWDVNNDPGQTALHNAFVNGTSIGLVLYVDGSDGGSSGYEFVAYMTNFTTDVNVAGLVTFSIQFENTGTVYTT